MLFLKIDKAVPGMILGKTLMSATGRVLLHAGVELRPLYIEKIKLYGFPGIYIDDEFSRDIIVDDVIPESVRQNMERDVKKMFSQLEKGEFKAFSNVVAGLKKAVYDVIDQIIELKGAVSNIVTLKNHDEYTFQHSVNVTVISIVLGKALGYDRDWLLNLGMAALFHDVGKTKIPLEILNKPGKLTSEEFDEVKKHSRFGYDFIKAHLDFPATVYVSVLEHHEKYNGEGYPESLSGGGIIMPARIIAVADVYDAVTSNRPYSEPMEPSEAYNLIISSAYSHFDPEIVEAFSKTISPYPVGSVVALSNGKLGIVAENYESNVTRPLIKLLPGYFNVNDSGYADLKNDTALAKVNVLGTA